MNNAEIITRLQQISMELVDKYYQAEKNCICELSSDIESVEKDIEVLDSAVREYKDELLMLLLDVDNSESVQPKVKADVQSKPKDKTQDKSQEIYTTYMENMKASKKYQTEILKGIKAGENIYTLFSKAAQAISAMTANKSFYNQVDKDLYTIYRQEIKQAENELRSD